MRQLRLLTLADDGSHLVLEGVVESADSTEQFGLPVDAALRDAVGADLPRLSGGPRPSPAPIAAAVAPAPQVTETGEAPIGPREIQVRVRRGESPAELAQAYGMPLERVMRFAGAAVEERQRIAGEARRARARRSTADGQVVVFGEAVDERFAAHGITADSVTWDAHRRDDGEWVVTACWLGGDATHTAEWGFSRNARTVTPIGDTAADLLSDRPIRPVHPPEPERLSLAAAPALRPGVVAFPPMPDAHTGPVPRVEDVFDQDAPPEGPREMPPLAPAAAVAATPALGFDTAVLDFEEPPLPLVITDPSTRPGTVPAVAGLRPLDARRRAESDDERAARARVPSWDDILLGVRRKSD